MNTLTTSRKYLGKHRGEVLNNVDPQGKGRLLVQVADVGGLSVSNWAMPCFPFAGMKMGLHALPQIGAGVWIEFEQGDARKPIWTGCFYGSSDEMPGPVNHDPAQRLLPSVVIQSQTQSYIEICDTPANGGIILQCRGAPGASARIEISDLGIVIDNGKGARIEMLGPKVSINRGSLDVIG